MYVLLTMVPRNSRWNTGQTSHSLSATARTRPSSKAARHKSGALKYTEVLVSRYYTYYAESRRWGVDEIRRATNIATATSVVGSYDPTHLQSTFPRRQCPPERERERVSETVRTLKVRMRDRWREYNQHHVSLRVPFSSIYLLQAKIRKKLKEQEAQKKGKTCKSSLSPDSSFYLNALYRTAIVDRRRCLRVRAHTHA